MTRRVCQTSSRCRLTRANPPDQQAAVRPEICRFGPAPTARSVCSGMAGDLQAPPPDQQAAVWPEICRFGPAPTARSVCSSKTGNLSALHRQFSRQRYDRRSTGPAARSAGSGTARDLQVRRPRPLLDVHVTVLHQGPQAVVHTQVPQLGDAMQGRGTVGAGGRGVVRPR